MLSITQKRNNSEYDNALRDYNQQNAKFQAQDQIKHDSGTFEA